MDESNLPKISMRIVRNGGKVKLTVGKYSLELKEIPNRAQTYDFLIIEQFVTNVAQLMYQDIIKKDQATEAFLKAMSKNAEAEE